MRIIQILTLLHRCIVCQSADSYYLMSLIEIMRCVYFVFCSQWNDVKEWPN